MQCDRRMMSVSAQLCLLACVTLTGHLTLALGSNQDVELTFLLPAGSTECFYQTTASNDTMEVEYQVIAGSGLAVGFDLISPSGHRVVSDFRQSEGIHTMTHTENGDYRLCFDNSFSKMSVKVVFFGVSVRPNSQSSGSRGRVEWEDMAMTDSLVEYKLEDIRATMDSVYQRLEKTRQVQASLRAFEARDRFLLEDNLWRVSFWSCLNLLVMLTVAATQIYTLQRLFDSNKRTCT
ncbi:transmembrane emp24 domain-containing protein 1-like [Hippoglossus stenolepis]|uniref:transmembrane emp24 domain-containing protein 1-like n=1 Tax=Hippoglossus stenolepis TaxID=195615 RepID=UPI00159C2F57|nr:transmembrane emp24 domain-containing protein 1-like [Hippoglossus stenolepis]